ncbi:MAG TPA: hypothetical protein VKP65_25960 [Rhodothermales bacterium]|nr:hypothetical protein [Rhodothermales bacterium]
MGQQQLLLLVFGIVVVMLAMLMGMIFFEESMQQRHVDLLVSHTVTVASEAVGWRAKHSPYLGGGDSYLKLDTQGMQALLMAEGRMPGIIKITRATKDELDIVAVSDQYPDIGVMTRVVGEEIVETTIAYDGSITLPEEN